MLADTVHPSEEILEEYHFCRLNPADEAALEEHLLLCETCQERLTFIDTFVHAFQDAHQLLPAASPRRSWAERIHPFFTLPTPAWAAMAACAVLGFGAWSTYLLRVDGAPAEVALTVSRGAEEDTLSAHVHAGSPLLLRVDLSDLAPARQYRVEVATADGSVLNEATAVPEGQRLSVAVPRRFSAGQYWVRLYAAGHPDLLREYSLTVTP